MVVDINYGSLQAIIWIEATYPPGAERWESLALFASNISIPPWGGGSFRSQKWHFLRTGSKLDSRVGQEGALALDETISRPSHCPPPPARLPRAWSLQLAAFQVFQHQSGRRHLPGSLCLVSPLE